MSRFYYYGARYYAAWLCRFTAVDPRKDSYPFQNSYAYAANNPVTFTDVNGEGPGEIPWDILTKLNYSDIEVDMSKAPDKFIAKNGKITYAKIDADGRRWNPQYYFDQAAKKAPSWWSKKNVEAIENGMIPEVDDIFLKQLGKNLNPKEFAELKKASNIPKTSKKLLTLEHHHLNHLDDAIGLPWKVHRGVGNTKFWHNPKYRKILKKGGGTALTLFFALASLHSIANGTESPIEAISPIPLPDFEDLEIEMLNMSINEGYESAIQFSNRKGYSVFYATTNEIEEFIQTGSIAVDQERVLSGKWYIEDVETLTEKITPYAVILKDGSPVGLTEVPQY